MRPALLEAPHAHACACCSALILEEPRCQGGQLSLSPGGSVPPGSVPECSPVILSLASSVPACSTSFPPAACGHNRSQRGKERVLTSWRRSRRLLARKDSSPPPALVSASLTSSPGCPAASLPQAWPGPGVRRKEHHQTKRLRERPTESFSIKRQPQASCHNLQHVASPASEQTLRLLAEGLGFLRIGLLLPLPPLLQFEMADGC